MHVKTALAALTFAFHFGLIACSGAPDDDGAPPIGLAHPAKSKEEPAGVAGAPPGGEERDDGARGMQIRKGCVRSRCEERREQDRVACERCSKACADNFTTCDFRTACTASCAPSRECSDYERNECAEEGFLVELPSDTSSELESACRAMFANANVCGWNVMLSSDVCTVYAAVERPERASDYRCVAELACDATDASKCDVEPSSFGASFCKEAEARCPGLCSKAQRERLDELGAWLRNDVMDVTRSCLAQETCGDAYGCFAAWLSAVDP